MACPSHTAAYVTGFCGLVRVCDDPELRERGVIRAVAAPRGPAIAAATANQSGEAAHSSSTTSAAQASAAEAAPAGGAELGARPEEGSRQVVQLPAAIPCHSMRSACHG